MVDTPDGGSEAGPEVYMYVDDTTLVDIIVTDSATLHLTTTTTQAHLQDLELERDFENLRNRAEGINMQVNARKTQLLVIARPNGCETIASLEAGGLTVHSVDALKLVGFTFGNDPRVGEHVRSMERKINREIWILYKLRKAGFKGVQLYRLYCCYLRSIIDYCSVVYHPMLTRGQSWDLERLQSLTLCICLGNNQETDIIMAKMGSIR